MSSVGPLVIGAVISVVAITAATVALCLGHLDETGFVSIVSVFGGAGVGVTAHAAGVRS